MATDNIARAKTFFLGGARMIGNGIEELWKIARKRPRISLGILAVAAAALIAGALFIRPEPDALSTDIRSVQTIRVGDISQAEPLTILGEVRSVKEASVAPDGSGTVKAVYRSLGDAVGAGSVIAELKNDSERAMVSQAQAALEKAKSGAAIGAVSLTSAETSFAASQESAKSAIQNAYATMSDTVRRKADQTFSNPESSQPRFLVASSDSQLPVTAENNRVLVQNILVRQAGFESPDGADAEIAELALLANEAKVIESFFANIAAALASGIPTASASAADISAYRADISAALSAINALRAMISATSENLKAKRAAVEIARESLGSGSGGTTADIAAAEAAVASAMAALERTVIRAPISGSIARIDLSIGEFVSAAVPAVYITNPVGLEAVAYVSERDIRDVAIGAQAIVGSIEGSVIRVARALDPITKKAEVRVALPLNAPFVAGESATIAITRSISALGRTAAIAIPLSAIKITPDGAIIFTVSAESTLVAHPITLGTLRGASVEAAGVTADMEIVEDARGLTEGQRVTSK